MNLNELAIIERTAQAKCGKRYIVTLDPLKQTRGVKSVLLRVQDKTDSETVFPIVLDADSTLHEVCDVATMLAEDLDELDLDT